ncbi:hypothetical protein IH992_31455 [Candidatus Poribacteria bacterium]|nr:hypothetical protein [Candidatus Poribacteria bacterium]
MTTNAIKAKYGQGVLEPEDKLWLDDAAQEMADHLAEIESEMPKDEVKQWHEAMSRAAKPARRIKGRGVVTKRL